MDRANYIALYIKMHFFNKIVLQMNVSLKEAEVNFFFYFIPHTITLNYVVSTSSRIIWNIW